MTSPVPVPAVPGETIQAVCVHDDGFEHLSDGSLPCGETPTSTLADLQRRFTEIIKTPFRCVEADCKQRYPTISDLLAHAETHHALTLLSPLAEKDAMSLEQRVLDLILRADSMRDSWVDPHGGAVAANALYGAAHDVLCDCEDSTVGHLAEWIAENRPTTARIARNGAST